MSVTLTLKTVSDLTVVLTGRRENCVIHSYCMLYKVIRLYSRFKLYLTSVSQPRGQVPPRCPKINMKCHNMIKGLSTICSLQKNYAYTVLNNFTLVDKTLLQPAFFPLFLELLIEWHHLSLPFWAELAHSNFHFSEPFRDSSPTLWWNCSVNCCF